MTGPRPRPPPQPAGIGKRNLAYLLFLLVLALPTDPVSPEATGRAQQPGYAAMLWGFVSLPFAVCNLLDGLQAAREGRPPRKPVLALLLVGACILVGLVFGLF